MQAKTDRHGIVLFDGVCNFCNRSIDFISRKDHTDYFRFAPLQSKTGQELLIRFNIPREYNESIVYIENGHSWQKSDALCRIMKKLSGGWKIFYVGIIIPRFLRDGLYSFIARHRYQWFGQRNTCRVPTEDEKKKFLV